MPLGTDTSASQSDVTGPDYVTHALLLGFKNSDLTPQIIELEHVMSSKLGWKTSLYWTDGTDPQMVQQRLDNIAYSLQSNLQHPEERIVIYYGGNALKNDEHTSTWKTDCGIMWHGSAKPGREGVCGSCELQMVDPSILLATVLKQPCDVLLLMDARADLCQPTLEQWMRKTALRSEVRKRNMHVVAFGDVSGVQVGEVGVEACPDCESEAFVAFESKKSSEHTKVLAQALINGAVAPGPGLDVDAPPPPRGPGLLSPLMWRLADKFDVTAILEYRPFSLPRSRPTAQPSAASTPRYKSTSVLLLRWDHKPVGRSAGEDDLCIFAMREAFESFNYGVEVAHVPEDADSHDAWLGHDGWVGSTVHKFVRAHGGAGNPVIIYYIGHGSVSKDSDAAHLEGWRTARGGPHFDLTRLQALADCRPYVLLILDCCYAGYVPAYLDIAYRHSATRPDHVMETLAACPSRSTTTASPPHNFSRRLAGQLMLHAGRPGGMSVDELSSLLVHDWRYRENSSGEERESKENVRILNCGEGSIVLERMKAHGGTKGGAGKGGLGGGKMPVDGLGEREAPRSKESVLGMDERSLGDRRLDVQRELTDRSRRRA
ncbi:hypothetical protein LTR36_009364 [Oleoguttula mirabilis]|uniref:Uncharacterized protein n=1 Tax=Oleoguttula mirabilis TaxID=1507867 RepID=A0AAV9JT49_9PEZI|nr:hypothetical protein LTR36_009364 [Oleoguttula mirabilis]